MATVRKTEIGGSKQCRLLEKLPSELRNSIYDLVVVKTEPVLIRATKSARRKRLRFFAISKKSYNAPLPALSRTCRQIYSETLPIFFASNSFMFVPACTAGPWPFDFGNFGPYLQSLHTFDVQVFDEIPRPCYRVDLVAGTVAIFHREAFPLFFNAKAIASKKQEQGQRLLHRILKERRQTLELMNGDIEHIIRCLLERVSD